VDCPPLMTKDDPLRTRRDAITPVTADSSASGFADPGPVRVWAQPGGRTGELCGADLAPAALLDVLSSLVDKSIVIRDELDGVVRFRMLETMRDYGREKLQETGEYRDLRRGHRDWYERLAADTEAGWISDRQLDLLARVEREQPNLREALEFCVSDRDAESAEAGLRTAAALYLFWSFRGQYGEGRRWLERALSHPEAHSIPDRVKALQTSTIMAAVQGNPERAADFVEQACTLAELDPASTTKALAAFAEAALALYRQEHDRAISLVEPALAVFESNTRGHLYISALAMLGWAHGLRGGYKSIDRLSRADTFHHRSVRRIAVPVEHAVGDRHVRMATGRAFAHRRSAAGIAASQPTHTQPHRRGARYRGTGLDRRR
jgi:non-specific serine/threonine protein kinase